MRRLALIFVLSWAFFLLLAGLEEPGPGTLPLDLWRARSPSPTQGPEQVVRYQLEALSASDQAGVPGALEVVFRFASPANRSSTGPIERFTEIVQSETYRPMLGHTGFTASAPRVCKDRWARQDVVLTTREGARVGYSFYLSRQRDPEFRGCWMTDGVMRFDPADSLGGPQNQDPEEDGWMGR